MVVLGRAVCGGFLTISHWLVISWFGVGLAIDGELAVRSSLACFGGGGGGLYQRGWMGGQV